MISVECPNCKSQLKAPPEAAGRTAKCKKCNTPIKIPSPQKAMAVSVPAVSAPPPIPSPVASSAPTKACDFCGEDVLVAAKKCKHCGEILDPTLRAAEESRRLAESSSRQQHFAQPQAPTVVQVINQQPRWSRGVAMVLSFFIPGLGQLYKGQVINGIVWMGLIFVCYIAALFTFGITLILGFPLHLLCIIGAGMGKNQ